MKYDGSFGVTLKENGVPRDMREKPVFRVIARPDCENEVFIRVQIRVAFPESVLPEPINMNGID